MSGKEYVEKKEKIFSLLMDVDDELVRKFFDQESSELLDEKIKVLVDSRFGSRKHQVGVLDHQDGGELTLFAELTEDIC